MFRAKIARAAEPTNVGEMLSEEFLKPMDITQEQLGQAVGLSRKVVGQIINNIRRISVDNDFTCSSLTVAPFRKIILTGRTPFRGN